MAPLHTYSCEQECAIEEVIVANTIPLPPSVNREARKVRQISVGKLLAQAIKCLLTRAALFYLSLCCHVL